jgi:hypothetical protein
VQADRTFTAFRARFAGKASPVHFFLGGFDPAATRDVPQAFLCEMKENLKATLRLPGIDETFQARFITTPTPTIRTASYGRAPSRKSIFTFHRIRMSGAFPPRP